ncbi:MAG: DMT family transporter [Pseudomonadota bacterium]
MNIALLFPILAIFAGAMTAFQPLVNAKLSQHLDNAIWASFVSFAVGTVILLVAGLALSGKWMSIEMTGLKWWMFTGGLLGAFFVTVAIYIVPYLGVATMIALMIAGQLLMAAILDNFGILSETANPITFSKIVGLSLIALGAFITLKL